MVEIIYFIILFMCFGCMLMNHKSKIIGLLGAIGGFIIFAGNNSNSDTNLYLFSFMTDDYERYEVGYKLYYSLLKTVGITDYQTTVIITFCVLGIIVYLVMRKITNNYVTVLCLLFIAELFIETVQIRTMIAAVFLFVAIYMYSIDGKKRALCFGIISSSFQMAGLFFVPFFLFGIITKEGLHLKGKNKYKFIGLFLVMYLGLLLCNNILNINLPLIIIETIGRKIAMLKHASYYFGGTAWGSVQFVVLYFANLLTIWYFRANSRCPETTYSDVIMDINIYAALSLPFLFVDMNFYRFFRMLNLSNFIYYANVLEQSKKNCLTVRNAGMIGIICISQTLWVASYLMRVPEIYTDIFLNNLWS